MPIERFLQLTLGVQIILSAFLLYVGQGLYWIAGGVAITELLAFLVVDRYRVFQLNQFWTNILTILVAIWCLYDLAFNAVAFQLAVSTANGLLLMELVLLFRPRTTHTYWLLYLLSFFQVVVGAAFRQSTMFGLLLIIFMAIAMMSLTALTFYRQMEGDELEARSEKREARNVLPHEPANEIVPNKSDERSASLASRFSPLASQIVFFPFCPRLFGHWLVIGLFSFVVCALFFLFTPRFGEGAYLGFSNRGGNGVPSIGFNDVVRLGDLGPSQKNPAVVCQVKLFQGDTDTPATHPLQIYLRGVALNTYTNHQWSFVNNLSREFLPQPKSNLKVLSRSEKREARSEREEARSEKREARDVLPHETANEIAINNSDKRSANLASRLSPLASQPLTRTEFTLEPAGRLDAFAVWPFYPRDIVQFRIMFTFNGIDQRLQRREFFTLRPHTYDFYTPSIVDGTQVEITPKIFPQALESLLRVPQDESGEQAVPSAQKIAQSWLDEAGLSVEKDGVEAVARHLCRKLRDSGEYVYSLNPQRRNRNVDPLEDFLTTHKAGHCEFFASALVVLLRSVGVPAQMIVGYLSDDYNKYGDFYTVRQQDAHAWVEVWIPPDQLDLDYNNPVPKIVTTENFESYKRTWKQRDWRYGGWLRLDPTPSTNVEATQVNVFLDWFGGLFDWMNVQWDKFFVKMDSQTQRKQVYDPVWKFWHQSQLGRWFSDFFRHIPVRTIVTVMILTLIAVYWVGKLGRILYRRLRWSFRKTGRVAIEARVDFYRRYEKTLQRYGFVRRPDQTPMEFAMELECQSPFTDWTISPMEIAQQYYAVRYGGQNVSDEWERTVEEETRAIRRVDGLVDLPDGEHQSSVYYTKLQKELQ